MTTKNVIPENIQALLDRADVSLLRGKPHWRVDTG